MFRIFYGYYDFKSAEFSRPPVHRRNSGVDVIKRSTLRRFYPSRCLAGRRMIGRRKIGRLLAVVPFYGLGWKSLKPRILRMCSQTESHKAKGSFFDGPNKNTHCDI